MKYSKWLFSIVLSLPPASSFSQTIHYDLGKMFSDGQIIMSAANETKLLPGTQSGAITSKGIIWLKGINFTEGLIDIDLRGKDIFLQSFLGIAFHGKDSAHTEIIYFRPFNFHHADSSRWKWSVAYMQLPDYNYARLRKEHPGMYENSIINAPDANDWFHAHISIENRQVKVFVNGNDKPSLEFSLLPGRNDGLLGLYSDGLTNDFANLTITKQSLQVHGLHWLHDRTFTAGRLDVDLRGNNIPGKSFLGLAFSGTDSNDCEVVYFRPFNFHNPDSIHRKHMLQYMSLPDHSWQQLRNSQPGVFEHAVEPIPDPDDWFHASMEITSDSVFVFVNRSGTPSLKAKRFRNHTGNKIAFWSDGLPGDFAGFTATENK